MSIDVAATKAALEAEGYVVLRRKSHEHTLRELDRARHRLEFEQDSRKHTRQWAHEAFDEQRRLADRLNAVCTAAAALGVSIQAINAALEVTPAEAETASQKVRLLAAAQSAGTGAAFRVANVPLPDDANSHAEVTP